MLDCQPIHCPSQSQCVYQAREKNRALNTMGSSLVIYNSQHGIWQVGQLRVTHLQRPVLSFRGTWTPRMGQTAHSVSPTDDPERCLLNLQRGDGLWRGSKTLQYIRTPVHSAVLVCTNSMQQYIVPIHRECHSAQYTGSWDMSS